MSWGRCALRALSYPTVIPQQEPRPFRLSEPADTANEEEESTARFTSSDGLRLILIKVMVSEDFGARERMTRFEPRTSEMQMLQTL